MRGASHQPAFMGSCLTISHMCLPCWPSGRVRPCVPGVIEESGDAWGDVNVGGWFASVVVEPQSDCKKSYLWWCWLLQLNLGAQGSISPASFHG